MVKELIKSKFGIDAENMKIDRINRMGTEEVRKPETDSGQTPPLLRQGIHQTEVIR